MILFLFYFLTSAFSSIGCMVLYSVHATESKVEVGLQPILTDPGHLKPLHYSIFVCVHKTI